MKRLILALIFVLLAGVLPANAQEFPARQQAIVVALYNLNIPLAKGSDDDRRTLTKKMIEQIVFEFPGQGWGWKSSSPTNPPSKDAVAQKQADGRLFAWDWQNGATREPQIPPLFHDITGQNFIAVAGVDHLGNTPPPPNPDLTARVAALEQRNADLEAFLEKFTMLVRQEFVRVSEAMGAMDAEIHATDEKVKELFNLSDNRCSKGRVAGVFSVRTCPEPRP